MTLFKNPFLKVAGVLALVLILAVGCSKTPKDPNPNAKPVTFITSYNIATVPDTANFYIVTVYWRASDVDGQPEFYRYWVDSGDTVFTFDTNMSMRMQFADLAMSHTFNVEARDNAGTWSDRPAAIVIHVDDVRDVQAFKPETEGLTVPPDGALTSRGVHFVVGGSDLDGTVVNFQWAIDDATTWVTVPPTFAFNSSSTLELDLLSDVVSLGAHVAFFRAVDNFGNVDDSPLSVSFVAVDSLRPDLAMVSGAIPNAFYFLPSGGNTVDLSTSWDADATWYFSTLTYRYAVDDSANWSPWITETSTTLTGLTAGGHSFFIQAMDLAGNSSLFVSDFGIGQLVGDRGILVVNGIDWGTYTPQPEEMYAANAPFGALPIHFWDLFTGQESYYPPNIASVFVGSGPIPGDSLGGYSSTVMMMNNFNGDLEVFQSMMPLIMSYLNAGGNILLAGRFGSEFIKGDLTTYGLSEGNSLEFNTIGVNFAALVAAQSGLVDIPRFASVSLSDLLAPSNDPAVTTLFTVNEFPESVGGLLVSPAGKGKFIFVAGRHYRMDHAAMATDYEYMLRNYFGEGQ